MRTWYFIPIIFSVILLVMVGVANWCFPKGEPYYTGEYEELYDGQVVRPEIEFTPSPKSNPDWVRFFQDNSGMLFVCSMAGFILAMWMRVSGEKTPYTE
ncbi:MAG: hypothetical protein D4R82_00680 [Dehalococcoidia bacterium]|jgi:hypothetical protein|nr:MAG: hypothetical protein D4R82_00680 [Dehalococcoidia bacterium]